MLGEAKIKKLSLQLQASGVTVTKYALTSWTVKCVDRETGEEIYYNTTLPQGIGSFATEEEAIKAIGAKIADEFSREFFLQHANVTSQKVALTVEGLPGAAEDAARERARRIARAPSRRRGPSAAASTICSSRKRRADGYRREWRAEAAQCQLGQACFSLGASRAPCDTADRPVAVSTRRAANSRRISTAHHSAARTCTASATAEG